jgi:hypothetical protein
MKMCDMNDCNEFADYKIVFEDGSDSLYCKDHLAEVKKATPKDEISWIRSVPDDKCNHSQETEWPDSRL